jgi:superfamily II DNA or RNA helicase
MPIGATQPPGIPPPASPPLPRATWFSSLFGYLRPRPLAAAVEVTLLDGERMALSPRFSLDGFTVSGALVAPPRGRPIAQVQTILGHRVRLDPAALGVIERIGGEPISLPLAEVGPTLVALATAGVPLTLRGTSEKLVVGPALPQVGLALGPDESLVVTSALLAPDGSPVTKPVDLALLRSREGWHADARCLVRIPLTGTPLDRLFLLDGAIPALHGAEVPEFLERLTRHPSAIGAIVRGPAVAETHRLINAPATTDFRVGVVERHGQSLLRVDPIHRHERFQVGHDEASATHAAGERWLRRRGAWIAIDGERVAAIDRTAASLGLTLAGEGFEFPAADRERVLGAFATLGGIRPTEAFGHFLACLADFDQIEEVPLPANLRAGVQLRPYQRHGVNWLCFLQRFGLNGILADDMGLGKTLQTLAAVERAREIGGSSLPVLIICPTSVMLNWRSEIGKFLDRSETLLFHGPTRGRQVERMTAAADAPADSPGLFVITSFDCARIDHDTLNRLPWLYVIVDEGHTIKNPDAKRSKAIKTIPGRHKLALTGTPIQNKLEELWSLFDFAMPGFLDSRGAFRRRYTINNRVDWPVVNDQLIPRIRPFVLRRLKSAVARDLPEKIIVERQVPLTPLQVTLYNAVRDSVEFRQMREAVEEHGVARSQTHIFAALTKLQNICNHPAIETGLVQARSALPADSGKLDLLQELIEEVVDGGHRALVFSQSTRVLDLVGHWFGQWGVTSLRIDGSTPALDRARLADTFNADASIHAFLLSTRAAGTGLNLVGADTVIFYDHDWNPANDAQAMDRAYRIGQTRNVTVYKLVSRGTLEEKILARQSEKLILAEGVIGADAGGFKDLSREELLDLFTLDGEA